jgi:hypothetical protein
MKNKIIIVNGDGDFFHIGDVARTKDFSGTIDRLMADCHYTTVVLKTEKDGDVFIGPQDLIYDKN